MVCSPDSYLVAGTFKTHEPFTSKIFSSTSDAFSRLNRKELLLRLNELRLGVSFPLVTGVANEPARLYCPFSSVVAKLSFPTRVTSAPSIGLPRLFVTVPEKAYPRASAPNTHTSTCSTTIMCRFFLILLITFVLLCRCCFNIFINMHNH